MPWSDYWRTLKAELTRVPLKRINNIFRLFLLAWMATRGPAYGAPPYSGTIFIDPDVITESDPSAFKSLEDAGRGYRTMYDRRPEDWVYLNAFLFTASFSDGADVEIQVNPEFSDVASARAEAQRYAPVIGRLPSYLRADVRTVWIHRGINPFGGGNNNLLIHTGQAEDYVSEGILEETLVHEACHTSLDAAHASSSGWLAAQAADNEFISTYARENPSREDVAESFLPYYAYRYRRHRIDSSAAEVISRTIPHRIAYFDEQSFESNVTDPSGPTDADSNQSNVSHSWLSATDRGSGWKSFDWFGYFYEASNSWVFHLDLGWFYRVGEDTGSTWLYFPAEGPKGKGGTFPSYEEWISGGQEIPSDLVFTGGTPWFDETTGTRRQPREVYELIYGRDAHWMWTTRNAYPFLYDSAAGTWKYSLRFEDAKLLFNYATGSWESF